MCLPTQGADLGNDVKIEGGSTDFAHRGTAYGIVLGMTDGHGDMHLKDGHIHFVAE